MDSRDLSSSSLMAANRDASSVDDDGVLSVNAGLAKEAGLLFQSGKFVECIDELNQLLQKKEGDPKILHNIAITEYFRDGCSDPKKFLEVLNNVKKRSEELAHASGEHVEAISNAGNKAILGSKGTNSMANQFSVANSSPIVYIDEFDTSVTLLNIAIIWFHLHEYSKALSILEPLYQKIEPIDEATALHICLLFLDVALASRNPWKFADVINYVEKAYCVGNLISQGDNGSSAQQQSSNLVAKSSSLPSNSSAADAFNLDSAASENSSENPLSRALSEDTLEYETFISTLDNSGHSLARLSGLQSSNDFSRIPADQSISTNDLRLKLHLYKVRLLLLTRNVKAAKREVKMAMNIARGKDSSMALLLKSQLEYARGNYRKAIKLLMASSNRTDMVLAARCFHKASLIFYDRPLLWLRIAECCLLAREKGLLKSSVAPSNGSEVKVHVIGKGKWRQLVLEDGISRNGQVDLVGRDDWFLGDDGQPSLSMSLARQCLFNALHLLNCSELKHTKSGLPCSSTLEENESREAESSKNENYKSVSSGESKASTLTAGSGQINANGDVKEQKAGNSQNAILQSSILDYEDICRRENQMIEQALLADLAYVELELENPLNALSTARSLLKLRECSRIYIFLGNVYAAESLCLLDQPKEAAEHLYTYLSGGNNVKIPYSKEDCEQWRVENPVDSEESNGGSATAKSSSLDESQGVVFLQPEEARGTLYANLAVMSALQGDLEQAQQFVMHALSTIPDSPEAIVTAIYVDLMLGKTQAALAKLKECSHIRFLPGSLKLNSPC
ncbi:hypothetical protein F0562_030156 [Nyssa sinensis]|uniref:CCR4-NOT transcription complex subunit 10 n=1 Tax=Nyssa sinensis TaxID=561372 RepID=A0A5J5AW79_9ASTE|nr:hypothetical protein F0562_030156 [Nyssa sinensis]